MIRYTLDKNKRGIDISKHLYGLFFEDINQAADGGLNAEMVINNSFEFEYITYDRFDCTAPDVSVRKAKRQYWDIYGAGPNWISQEGGMDPENNPSYLFMNIGGEYHVENPGYAAMNDFDLYGMAIEENEVYNFSMYIRRFGFVGEVRVYIRDARGQATNVSTVLVNGGESCVWEKVTCSIQANRTTMGRLCIVFVGNGKLGIDYVSLLPSHVWGDPNKYTEGKLSPRIVQALQDVHGSFLRFPGGCVVEGDVDFEHMYKWRNTIGPLTSRKQIANVWQYLQSYGVGFYEYFCLCEDLHMAPLPVLHCGLLCQIRMGEQRRKGYQRIMPGTYEFQHEVIDNVADLLFFAKGDPASSDRNESYWASIRVSMGHPAPFELEYVGIGNENWGYEYFDNLSSCMLGLRQYHYKGRQTDLIQLFNVTVVTCSGVDIRPQDSSDSWKVINQKYRDMIVDEHVYNSYQWFLDNSKRYDSYDRNGAKVFMGEYAMHTSADGRGRLNGDNNLQSALSEAAFLTGCERNSDVVRMTCYAPLFACTSNYRWTPDMIWFNPRDIMYTPNYYVQQMFASNTGKYLLNDVAPVNKDNSGGLLIAAHKTCTAVRSVTVKDLASGEVVYYHNFKDGMGGWKVYPRCIGGEINADGELVIYEGEAFNGFYYDEQSFSNCEVEIDFRRIEGLQSFIAGVGVAGVEDHNTMDCAAFTISCQYGKHHKGFDVSFDKRVDYIRTVCEMMGKDKFHGYDPDGNKMRLVYTQDKLVAYIFQGGQWHEILDKNIWKVNERVFQTASFDDAGKIYLKVVNVSGEEQELDADIANFGVKTKAKCIMLANDDPSVVNEIGVRQGVTYHIQPTESEVAIEENKLRYTLPKNSVTIFVIE